MLQDIEGRHFMNRIAKSFEKAKAEKRCAFIPFLTAGDPSLVATQRYIRALDDAGSSIIEIGIPFSDPVADGPTIQAANIRALEAGVKLVDIFNMVEALREEVAAALVFLTYANRIEHYGVEVFFEKCQQVGVDGVIIPDMPLEEIDAYEVIATQYGVDVIRLIAPTSKDRIEAIVKGAKGFLYCVSSMGVTGVRQEITTNLGEMLRPVQEVAKVPTAVGFGISTKEQIEAIKEHTEGIIVGSAIVKLIEQYGEEAEEKLHIFAKEMVEACYK